MGISLVALVGLEWTWLLVYGISESFLPRFRPTKLSTSSNFAFDLRTCMENNQKKTSKMVLFVIHCSPYICNEGRIAPNTISINSGFFHFVTIRCSNIKINLVSPQINVTISATQPTALHSRITVQPLQPPSDDPPLYKDLFPSSSTLSPVTSYRDQ